MKTNNLVINPNSLTQKNFFIFNEDNMNVLSKIPDNSIDSVVTDPPYGISFMGNKWDHNVPTVELWSEVYRVLKPGGYLLSFSSSRTYHRMTVNIEDAGFEIKDQLMWVYGQGFPKPTGYNLKPAHEPICMAMKPISEKSIIKNIDKYGTGGLNIEGCRIGEDVIKVQGYGTKGFVATKDFKPTTHIGRHPSNFIIDEMVSDFLEENHKFYYCSKPNVKERLLCLEENDVKHPTLKPVDLMRYLVRLVTPKNGIVLDPFMGAGTTGVASLLEEFKFVGIELDEQYFESGQRRINNYQEFRDLKKKKTKKSNLDKKPLQK